MGLSEILRRLPDDYEVVLRPKGGSVTYTDTAAHWVADDGKVHQLTDFELVTKLHLSDAPDPDRPDVDWQTFWTHTVTEHDWLIEPIIPRGRSIALYAPAGEGKSELVLAIACQAALKGISVLYLDFEMTSSDLMDRLYDMEYGPETDLSNLHYQLHPSIPTLDTPEGGEALSELAAERNADLIIIDTFMRIIAGKENDSDTLLSYDLHTGRLLKSAGRSILRLDHAGKDITQGARGTSAKRDDVDLIWRLQRREGGVRLKAEKRRMGWVPEYVDLARDDFPVTYGEVPATWPEGTKRLAKVLDDLEVDTELGRPAVREILKKHGETAKNAYLSAAIRYRREYHHQLVMVPGQPKGQPQGQVPKTPGQERGQAGVYRDTPGLGQHPELASFGGVEEDEPLTIDDISDDLPDPFE